MNRMKKQRTNYSLLSYGDLVGEFGVRFVCLNPFLATKNSRAFFICPRCNKDFEAQSSEVKRGNTKSCGCKRYLHKKLYSVWKGIRYRTLNPNYSAYHTYGGRGIGLCEEWLDFYVFQDWALSNGYEEGLSIDRIENNLGYCPCNCRWTTTREQTRNRRPNVWWVIDGQKMCEADAAQYLGRSPSTIRYWRLDDTRMPNDLKDRVDSVTQEKVN